MRRRNNKQTWENIHREIKETASQIHYFTYSDNKSLNLKYVVREYLTEHMLNKFMKS